MLFRSGWTIVSVPLKLVLEQRLLAAAQHDVELVGEHVERHRGAEVEGGDQALGGRAVGDAEHHRVAPDQRVALEVHLGDQPLREAGAEHREVDVGRAPGIEEVAPGVGPGLDGAEVVVAVGVGQRAAAAAEVRVDRREVAVTSDSIKKQA